MCIQAMQSHVLKVLLVHRILHEGGPITLIRSSIRRQYYSIWLLPRHWWLQVGWRIDLVAWLQADI